MQAISKLKLDYAKSILRKDLLDKGIHSVILIDKSGNILINLNNDPLDIDTYSLASIAAANIEAVSVMAEILGEKDMYLLFHKGQNLNIHFKRILSEFLLISIFDKSISLGFLRLKTDELNEFLEDCLSERALSVN
jgi:predicted regulator of Ras-like GTPase activity (Roadblock/LC7/MglB family)